MALTRKTKVLLTESDVAMVDALSILFDIAVANRDAVARTLDKTLELRARHWERASRPKTAAILTLLRKRSTEKNTLAPEADGERACKGDTERLSVGTAAGPYLPIQRVRRRPARRPSRIARDAARAPWFWPR